jgi:hypothetical protein
MTKYKNGTKIGIFSENNLKNDFLSVRAVLVVAQLSYTFVKLIIETRHALSLH